VRERGKVKGKGGAGFGASTCFMADVSGKDNSPNLEHQEAA